MSCTASPSLARPHSPSASTPSASGSPAPSTPPPAPGSPSPAPSVPHGPFSDVNHADKGTCVDDFTYMDGARIEGARIDSVHIEGAHIKGAHIDGAQINGAHFECVHINGIRITEELSTLFSQCALGNRASGETNANATPARAFSGSDFTVPPFPFVRGGQASVPSDELQPLLKLFPFIPRDTILEIIHFEFLAFDVRKLGSIELDHGLEAERTVANDYPTLDSLMGPLFVYFQILGCYAASSGSLSTALAIHRASLAYCAHLSALNHTYEWPAILQYHSQFFYRRSCEMARGEFSGWRSPDNELMDKLLFGHNLSKSPSSMNIVFVCVVFLTLHVCLILGTAILCF